MGNTRIKSVTEGQITDAGVEQAYNNQVPIISKTDAEEGQLTTICTWTPQRIRQAIKAIALAGNTFARVVKKVDETINNSTTLQNDDELTVSLDANAEYSYLLLLTFNSPIAPDIKFVFAVPSGATIDWSDAPSTAPRSLIDGTIVRNEVGSTVNLVSSFSGRISVGGTAGLLQFLWAQLTADASDTKVLKGTLLVVWKETG